jgi:hypothetical protein
MHLSIQVKTTTLPLFTMLMLTCFALSPRAQAACQNGCLENRNTALGDDALITVTSGISNTAVGNAALKTNRGGDGNTATGRLALSSNTNGKSNTATGMAALRDNTTGNRNTATGRDSLLNNTIGNENTATGLNALGDNSTGDFNSAIGSGALFHNTAGNRNTAIGLLALQNNTTGNFNVALGDNAGGGVITANDVICIGRGVNGVNVSGTCFIGNIRGVTTQNANALPVVIDGAGQLGTVASSERFKKDIAIMGQASEGILALRPVTFHYKTDGENTPQFGLIAEEVAKVNPALVLPDKEGKPYTVRYDAVNAMLLNEFLKARRQIDAQQKQIESLTAGLQKVSAQLEASKPAPQVVNNP